MTTIEKELLASQIKLLLGDMMKEYKDWRGKCGHAGWYDIPDEWTERFFQKYLIDAVKKTRNISLKSNPVKNKDMEHLFNTWWKANEEYRKPEIIFDHFKRYKDTYFPPVEQDEATKRFIKETRDFDDFAEQYNNDPSNFEQSNKEEQVKDMVMPKFILQDFFDQIREVVSEARDWWDRLCSVEENERLVNKYGLAHQTVTDERIVYMYQLETGYVPPEYPVEQLPTFW